MALFYIANGLNHFLNQKFYMGIMPPRIPWHKSIVILSGIAEILLGGMLLIPALSQQASWGIIVLLILIFPANIHMAFNTELYPDYRPLMLNLRLPLQLVFIAWAYWYT
jgi:uncharacterized membrane protein